MANFTPSVSDSGAAAPYTPRGKRGRRPKLSAGTMPVGGKAGRRPPAAAAATAVGGKAGRKPFGVTVPKALSGKGLKAARNQDKAAAAVPQGAPRTFQPTGKAARYKGRA